VPEPLVATVLTTETDEPQPLAAPAPPSRVTVAKRSAPEAWSDWRATGTAAAAASFCTSVSSWIEGTSAQLIRPLWPSGGVRPSLMDVQSRLRHGLALVVTKEPDYVKGLAAARHHVEQDLARARARDMAAG